MLLNSLKDHPFAVEAFFNKSIILTFAIEKEKLEKYIPSCLNLDIYHDKWAFIAIALVDTRDLKPKGFHKIFGNDFWLIGVRIFVTYTNCKGKNLRGLYIIKSETNKFIMQCLGNLFTHYNYSITDIAYKPTETGFQILSKASDLKIDVDLNNQNPTLPVNSVFPDWKTARRYAGPLPFTFRYNEVTNEILIIEGERHNWQPKPIAINSFYISYLKVMGIEEYIFSNAFIVENIPYVWKKGLKEKVLYEKTI